MRMHLIAASVLAVCACSSENGVREEIASTEVTASSSSQRTVPGSNINIQTIPHASQRYNTGGDYWIDANGVRQIRISDFGDPNLEFLILIHELVEIKLNEKAGVTDAMVDQFDFEYERNRLPGDESEPGDDPRAPYYRQHQFATRVERDMAEQLGVDWDTYGKRYEEMLATYPER
jgi:hypothetical protein